MDREWFSGAGSVLLLGLCLNAGVANAAEWSIDGSRAEASFRVQVRIMPATEGRFRKVAGALRRGSDGLLQVSVVLDAGDLTFAGPDWLARVTCSEKFLDVVHYPAILFESSPFTDAFLRHGGALTGHLTLRGQRKAVAFSLAPSTCDKIGTDCPLRVSGSVSRRAFGMQAYRLAVRDQVAFAFQVYLQTPLLLDRSEQ